MHTGVNPETECPHCIDDRVRASHAAGRTVEGGEEAVAGRIDLVAPVPLLSPM